MIKVLLFAVLKKNFFSFLHNINCSICEHVACDDVDLFFDIKGALESPLVDLCDEIKVSKPISCKRDFGEGELPVASLSHHGVLAVCFVKKGWFLKYTDLRTDIECLLQIEECSKVGFYDESTIILSDRRPIRYCQVDSIFEAKNMSVTKSVGPPIYSYTDVSTLHSTRVLLFTDLSYVLLEYNVDSREITETTHSVKPSSIGSLTGIYMGVRSVLYNGATPKGIFSLGFNGSETLVVNNLNACVLTAVLPSSSNQTNPSKALMLYWDNYCVANEIKKFKLPNFIMFEKGASVVRLMGDVFLGYGKDIGGWVLFRLVVQ